MTEIDERGIWCVDFRDGLPWDSHVSHYFRWVDQDKGTTDPLTVCGRRVYTRIPPSEFETALIKCPACEAKANGETK